MGTPTIRPLMIPETVLVTLDREFLRRTQSCYQSRHIVFSRYHLVEITLALSQNTCETLRFQYSNHGCH